MNPSTIPPKKRRWKTRALALVGALIPVLTPVLQTVGDVVQLPGTALLTTLKSLGSNNILTDPHWGTTSVKTQSYGGDLAVGVSQHDSALVPWLTAFKMVSGLQRFPSGHHHRISGSISTLEAQISFSLPQIAVPVHYQITQLT